ncbi:MAG: hypothetical protein JST85_27380 [Acidobacteria bacterium]|nr:hypothetical protein [Acidobacteriota bacterium]
MAIAIGAILLGMQIHLRPRRFNQFFYVRPEHLKLGVFKIAKVILFDCEYEDEKSPDAHQQTGNDCDPGKNHLTVPLLTIDIAIFTQFQMGIGIKKRTTQGEQNRFPSSNAGAISIPFVESPKIC